MGKINIITPRAEMLRDLQAFNSCISHLPHRLAWDYIAPLTARVYFFTYRISVAQYEIKMICNSRQSDRYSCQSLGDNSVWLLKPPGQNQINKLRHWT